MRKLSIGLLTLALAATVFTSCKKDTNAAPVVSFTNIADSISSIIVDNDSYDLTIQVTSEAGLKEVKISETKNGTTSDKETITDFTDNASFTKVYTVTGIPTAGMEVIVSATDKDDQNTSRIITLKKKAETVSDITAYTAVLLYDAKADKSSLTFFDPATGAVTFNNASSAIFGFYYDETYASVAAALISSDKYSLTGAYSALATSADLKTASGFDAITDAAGIQSAYTAGTQAPAFGSYPAGTIVKQLTAGQIIAFKYGSKYGILKVNSVDNTSANKSISIDVKVQK